MKNTVRDYTRTDAQKNLQHEGSAAHHGAIRREALPVCGCLEL